MKKDFIEMFCNIWEMSESLGEVAKTLEINKLTASSYACQIRKMGVTLKLFPRRPVLPELSDKDVKRINERIKRARARDGIDAKTEKANGSTTGFSSNSRPMKIPASSWNPIPSRTKSKP